MFSTSRRRGAHPDNVGVAWTPYGVAVARVTKAGDTAPRLVLCEERKASPVERGAVLAELVRQHGLRGAQARVVLDPATVTLRLLDRPPVPDAELRDAVRWQLRGGLDYDLEAAVLDLLVFDDREMRNRQPRVHVATTHRDVAREAVDALVEAGLRPEAVEVREASLLRLPPPPPAAGALTAILRLDRKQGVLSIGRGEELLLGRPVSVGWEALEDGPDPAASERERGGAIEELALDVQRSLDWLERTYDQGPVRHLWLAPAEGELGGGALSALSEMLRLEVAPLELRLRLDCDVVASQERHARCLEAVAAALAEPGRSGLDLSPREEAQARDPFAPRSLALGVGIVAGILAAAVGAQAWRVHESATARAVAERDLEALADEVAELEAEVTSRQAHPETEARIQSLREAHETRVRLLEVIAGLEPRGRGIAPVLEGLAGARVAGVWLHEIYVREGGTHLDLRGSTLEPDGLARLLVQLQDVPALAGRGFRVVRLRRADEEPWRLDFQLASEPEENAP